VCEKQIPRFARELMINYY